MIRKKSSKNTQKCIIDQKKKPSGHAKSARWRLELQIKTQLKTRHRTKSPSPMIGKQLHLLGKDTENSKFYKMHNMLIKHIKNNIQRLEFQYETMIT